MLADLVLFTRGKNVLCLTAACGPGQSTRKVPKKRFPTNLVYGQTKGPSLRLITCDGRFDRATGHYVDNYVVFAAGR